MSTAMDTKYRHEIMGWLSTLDFKTEQEDLLSRSVFIGKWLLKSDEFMRWVKGSRWQLRCYGEAGTGKIRHLVNDMPAMCNDRFY